MSATVAIQRQYPRPTYIPRDPRQPILARPIPSKQYQQYETRADHKITAIGQAFNLQLHVHYWTQPSQWIALVGQNEDWNPKRGLRFSLQPDKPGAWTLQLPTSVRDTVLEFKLVLLDDSTGLVTWEGGQNRLMSVPLSGNQGYFLEWRPHFHRRHY